MKSDFAYSVERVALSEEHRARVTGFGTNRQGQAINRQYREQLANRIGSDRLCGRRDRAVWRALKGCTDDDLAFDLLVAGVSVCWDGRLGVDDGGQKNFRDIALWVGRVLGQRKGELALKVGAWGINMLVTALPTLFTLDKDVLSLPLTDSLDSFLDQELIRGIRKNPYLSPFAQSHGHSFGLAACQLVTGRAFHSSANIIHRLK
jgi:hypothetical protein